MRCPLPPSHPAAAPWDRGVDRHVRAFRRWNPGARLEPRL